MLRIPALLSGALLAHDIYRCLERPGGALPPERLSFVTRKGAIPDGTSSDFPSVRADSAPALFSRFCFCFDGDRYTAMRAQKLR